MKKYIKYISYTFVMGVGLIISLFIVSEKNEKVDAGAPVSQPKHSLCGKGDECMDYDRKYKHCHAWTCASDDNGDGGYYYEEVEEKNK